MKRVLIVEEGEGGSMGKEESSKFIELIRETLEEAFEKAQSYPGSGEKLAEVQVAKTAQDAEEIVRAGWANVVLFVSRGMGEKAEQLAKIYPRLRVIIFADLIPKGKVTWVLKSSLNRDLITEVISW